MSCERYRAGLLDVALGAPAWRELEAHLPSCPACRQALEEERRLMLCIDEELQRAVAVAPTLQFLPRVRERVAKDASAGRPWALQWLVPVMVSVAALAAAVYLAQRTAPAPRPSPSGSSRLEPPAPPRAEVEPGPLPSSTGQMPVARVRRAPASRVAEPEVLVPPAEEVAFRRFVAGLGQRRLNAGSLVAAGAEPRETEEIAIAPIEVKPLEVESLTLEHSM